MAATVVIGTQWGDEGKGKVVDFLSAKADAVVRFQGGANAGHTIINEFGESRLHLVPSGIFRRGVINLLGTGTVVDTTGLLQELRELEGRGVQIDGFRLSDRAQVVLPLHILVETAEERLRGGKEIGTTGRGIGPAYATKAARFGLQVGDLLEPRRMREALELLLGRYEAWLGLTPAETRGKLAEYAELLVRNGEALRPYVVDSAVLIRDWVRSDKNVILEGQLGIMRDLDWGIYPFVTSSNPTAGGACAGGGIPPRFVGKIIGVVKAYTSAVGAGPVPTEDQGELGEHLRSVGGEYGTTTGRPRRCGWLDLVAVRYACQVNGIDNLAVTKLDVLDDLAEIKVCTGYRTAEAEYDLVPQARFYEHLEPVYTTLPGWQSSTREARCLADLPAKARAYVEFIAAQVGVCAGLISVGPRREQTIHINDW